MCESIFISELPVVNPLKQEFCVRYGNFEVILVSLRLQLSRPATFLYLLPSRHRMEMDSCRADS